MFVLVKCLLHDLTKQLACSRLVKSDWLNRDDELRLAKSQCDCGETVPGKPPRENSHLENSQPSNSPLENSPRKIPTQKILIWNIPTHIINCLSSLNTSSINGQRIYMYIFPLKKK